MKRRYDIGLNSRVPFIRARRYLEENFGEGIVTREETIQGAINVPVAEYSRNGFRVRLIGNELIDRRFLEMDGGCFEIWRTLRDLRKNQVRMVKV